jgi:hypothetical protein
MSKTTVLQVKNLTGATIKANTVVYLTGTTNDLDAIATVDIASNDDATKMPACGILRDDLKPNEIGLVKITGKLGGIDTTTATEINAPVFVGIGGAVIFQNPSDYDNNALVQQLGTVSFLGDLNSGQVYLFPLELQRKHAPTHAPNKWDQFIHAQQHEIGGGDEVSHSQLVGLKNDDHTQYSLVDGTRPFTGAVSGITPTATSHLTTKQYVDGAGVNISSPAASTATYVAYYSAAQAITGNSHLTYNSALNVFTANSAVVVGTPTGGSQGTGTINAQAVYDDSVLLTCYVPEFVKNGSIDLEKWDQTIENPAKAHNAAHRFSQSAKEELDPTKYAKKWRENGHLPAMPSMEEWAAGKINVGRVIQGLWETIEVLAEHVRQLNNKLEAKIDKRG